MFLQIKQKTKVTYKRVNSIICLLKVYLNPKYFFIDYFSNKCFDVITHSLTHSLYLSIYLLYMLRQPTSGTYWHCSFNKFSVFFNKTINRF